MYFSVLKPARNLFQIINDRQVLRTHLLALTAGDTFGGFSERLRQSVIIGEGYRPALFLHVLAHDLVVQREILRDSNVLRAAVSTIGTACAGNGGLRVDDVSNLKAQLLLVLGKGDKVFHKGGVIL